MSLKTSARIILVAAPILFSPLCQAQESAHSVGGSMGYGFHEFETQDNINRNFSDSLTADIYYRYMLSDYFGVEVGATTGSGGAFSILSDIWTDVKRLQYHGVRSNLITQVPLNHRHSLYLKTGLTQQWIKYDIEIDDVRTQVKDTDHGFYGAVGWQFSFNSGMKLSAEYQHVPLNQLTLRSYNVGVNWPI
ncbi:porin family protein [Shewanella sp. Scap07]|uniref:porin family protein n=1 Tax=Shewanella sp. Scap07 TaxID=2589987 RepID=UPI0015BA54C6|nr:porin family protein [Shewanella sp. Scap07]QLE86427.1 porin family protein [Shewanella sp. Scap07]